MKKEELKRKVKELDLLKYLELYQPHSYESLNTCLDRNKTIFKEAVTEDITYEEIGKRHGITRNYVRSIVHKIYSKLINAYVIKEGD